MSAKQRTRREHKPTRANTIAAPGRAVAIRSPASPAKRYQPAPSQSLEKLPAMTPAPPSQISTLPSPSLKLTLRVNELSVW